MTDFPVSLKVSYFEEVVVVGTQLGRVDIYDYFDASLLDYQVVHSSPVMAIELDHRHKDGREAGVGQSNQNFIYASDIDDPRNKNKYLAKIYSLSQEELARSLFYRRKQDQR